MYIVYCEGMYRHEIKGMFGDYDEAKAHAKIAISREIDDYHQMVVLELVTEKLIDDGIEVCRYYRNGKEIYCAEKMRGDE